jgi:hypothetical protein
VVALVSLYEYRESMALGDASFYALIMAAMRRADSYNITRLRAAFPETWEELHARYHAPGGLLPGEVAPE